MAKQKIAVLGGGMGVLSAVFAITGQPGWADQYDITVYQLGWRLGGKAATSRDEAHANRVLEHGYHMLFGFYENTFATLRSCYAELGRDPGQPLSAVMALTAEDEALHPGRYAFHRQNTAVLQQQLADGTWHNLVFDFPPNTDLPGDAGEMPSALAYIEMAVELLARVVGHITVGGPPAGPAPAPPTWWERLKSIVPHLLQRLDPASHEVHGHRGHLELIRALVRHLVDLEARGGVAGAIDRAALDALVDLMRCYLKLVWALVGREVNTNWEYFTLWTASDFACTLTIGLIEDGVVAKGLDSIDDLNFWEWIAKHATVPEGTYVTNSSCWMQAAYDSSFAYEQGDSTSPRTATKPLLGRPTLGAGTTVRGALRLGLAYKGALAWKFQAGCGEALVAPVYEVLRRRGVRFAFFSKVEHLGVGDDHGAVVESIRIQQQVTVRGGGEYQPLIDVRGLPCWPSEPLWAQIEHADAVRGQNLESDWTSWPGVGTRTLTRGVDFDHVLLGIPLGALPAICGDLIASSPAWRAMIDAIPTVRTMAMQVWVNRDLQGMGWTGPNAPVGIGVEPIDTWADMTELLARETWPDGPGAPKGISYFCCAMADDPNQPPAPDASYAASQLRVVRESSIAFLNTQSSQFWPAAQTPGGFDWQVLVGGNGRGADRIDDQYLRANIDASERYVLSPAGSAVHRLPPGQSGFRNLTLAGDWTDTALNAGCMEATVMSGLAASRAIAGYPQVIPGETDFGRGGPRRQD